MKYGFSAITLLGMAKNVHVVTYTVFFRELSGRDLFAIIDDVDCISSIPSLLDNVSPSAITSLAIAVNIYAVKALFFC